MADFKQAHSIVMVNEGGYANNPLDNGGETYKGIARKFWSASPVWSFIDAHKLKLFGALNVKLSEAQVEQLNKAAAQDAPLQNAVLDFYKKNFWDRLSLDQVNDQSIAVELYDTAVNMSDTAAATFLQRSLNVLNNRGKAYADVTIDGKIGAVTVAITNAHPNPKRLLKVLNVLQGAKYVAICEANPSQEVFMSSWMSRVGI